MERKDDEHISGRTLKGEKDMVVRRTVSAAFTWEQFKEILASGNAKETFGKEKVRLISRSKESEL